MGKSACCCLLLIAENKSAFKCYRLLRSFASKLKDMGICVCMKLKREQFKHVCSYARAPNRHGPCFNRGPEEKNKEIRRTTKSRSEGHQEPSISTIHRRVHHHHPTPLCPSVFWSSSPAIPTAGGQKKRCWEPVRTGPLALCASRNSAHSLSKVRRKARET